MKVKDLNFRDIDRHFFFIEDLNHVKKIYKKLHIKDNINPILVSGYINHETGIQFRILGNIIIDDNITKIEEKFIKKEFTIPYDFFEDIEIKEVPLNIITNIKGIASTQEDVSQFYSNEALLKSRENTLLDNFRDLRLIDDVQFLLLNKDEKQENVWARIDSEEENGMIKCTLIDKTKKVFGLKNGSKIYIKYIDHPKYKGLIFVKKA